MKWLPWNFDIGDLWSGHFCNLSIIIEWEKVEKRLFFMKTILNTKTSGYR